MPCGLDEKGVLICEGSRFEENSEASFSIFVDDVEAERSARGGAPRTPRGIRQSTKENIIAGSACSRSRSKSLGTRSELGEEDVVKRALNTSEAKDRSIADLQKTVESLETSGREAQTSIAGLLAEKAQLQKVLRRAIAPEAIASMVADLVGQELEAPREVLCLQRKQWERQAEKVSLHIEKLERKAAKNREELLKREEEALAAAAAAEARAGTVEELLLQREAEVARLLAELAVSHAEANNLKHLTDTLQESAAEREQQAMDAAQALELSKLEEKRLGDMLAVSQESIEKYMEREAQMAGHMNHKQKIRVTLDLKKENCSLQSQVAHLQQQLLISQQRQPRASATSVVEPMAAEEIYAGVDAVDVDETMPVAIAKEVEIAITAPADEVIPHRNQ